MVVGLCHGIALAEPPDPFLIRFDDLPINRGGFFFQPGKEGRTEIEAQGGVIVVKVEDLSFIIDDPGVTIWPITFEGDPFVPVMEGAGALLLLDGINPRVLPRRLVEMAVNGYKCVS
jgi:hypothetical protein